MTFGFVHFTTHQLRPYSLTFRCGCCWLLLVGWLHSMAHRSHTCINNTIPTNTMETCIFTMASILNWFQSIDIEVTNRNLFFLLHHHRRYFFCSCPFVCVCECAWAIGRSGNRSTRLFAEHRHTPSKMSKEDVSCQCRAIEHLLRANSEERTHKK